MYCEECGNHDVGPAAVEGIEVLECALCGALAGDEVAVHRVLMIREARDHGIDPEIYPLVTTLNRSPSIHVAAWEAGDVEGQIWPYVQFTIEDEGVAALESLMTSLAMTARTDGVEWMVEVEFQNRLQFRLRSRHEPPALDAAGLALARVGLAALRRNLDRDMRLSWWRDG